MERLREMRKNKRISMKQLGEIVGVAESTISLYETGKRQPDFQTLQKIASYFNCSLDYLLGVETVQKKSTDALRVPVLGYVAAGIPIEEIEDILDYEELNADQFNPNYQYFGLKIKGDSMMPRIQNGDVVIVRVQPDVDNGDIAIVRVNGDEATCKQIKKHPDGVSLISFNPAYEPMFFTNQEVIDKPLSVIGKVVELRGKF